MDRRYTLYLVALSILLSLLAACAPFWGKPLPLTGDVGAGLAIHHQGTLAEALNKLGLTADAALIVAKDGAAVRIGREAFGQLELRREWSGWVVTGDSLPPSCNLNELQEICLQTSRPRLAVSVLHGVSGGTTATPFALRLREFAIEGTAGRNGYQVIKYSCAEAASPWSGRHTAIVLHGLPREVNADTLALAGTHVLAGADTLAALWFSPPASLRTPRDQLASLADDSAILVCVVEGLSWPVVAHLQALGVETGLPDGCLMPAAVLHSDDAAIMPRFPAGTTVVTSAPVTLATGVKRIVVRDFDNDGDVDSDVYAGTLMRIQDTPASLVAYFNGLAEAQAQHGAFSHEAVEQARRNCVRIANLAARWPGAAYIVGLPADVGLDARHRYIAMWGKL
ncbi:MAG: hypothetical protein K8R90_02915 [Candidatus Cloacimonetes bacterium]|nr:hypothetical protein [Candidatus Cloacimonadota bacterium]